MKIILASSSPRRQNLLTQINLPFTLRSQSADESQVLECDPILKVQSLAQLKSDETSVYDGEIVITADTIVSLDEEIFEKPSNAEEAYYMIKSLSGNVHQVHTAVVMKSNSKTEKLLSSTDVHFYALDDNEIYEYIHTKEPYDKAGAYGIQSSGAKFVKEIHGDYHTIVGLPINKVYQALKNWEC